MLLLELGLFGSIAEKISWDVKHETVVRDLKRAVLSRFLRSPDSVQSYSLHDLGVGLRRL
jgi:hypothetical protein